MFKKLPVNKKQLQDFVKELLFEKSVSDLKKIIEKTDCNGLPGAVKAILRAVEQVSESGDVSKLKPLLDFAFERETLKKR